MTSRRLAREYRSAGKRFALVGIPLLVALGGWVKLESQRPLDATALRIAAGEIRSYAAESRLLLQQDRVATADYVAVHRRMLRDKIDEVARQLQGSRARPGLQASLDQATALTTALAAAVPGPSRELARIATSAADLEQRLQPP